jgi:DNA recombination protein RmuC
MLQIVLLVAILLALCVLIALLLNGRRSPPPFWGALQGKVESLEKETLKLEQLLGEQARVNREDGFKHARDTRDEISKNMFGFSNQMLDALKKMVDLQVRQLENLTQKMEGKLTLLSEQQQQHARLGRQELATALQEFQTQVRESIRTFENMQKEKLQELGARQEALIVHTERKLEQMRETVDEKLHKTLEERLGQSFALVSTQLQEVQKGLGEMQNLATGVGDLKRVLNNVKTGGTLGEIQLANILEQIMAPEQYEAHVRPKPGSNEVVEFAIRLPAGDDLRQTVYLPIDAKFPQSPYLQVQAAYEAADPLKIDEAVKALDQAIKKAAKDIRDKYLSPPHTTDFGVMFLPFEGLYAEVARRPALLEQLQREYRVIVTGPSTLAAMLNSLQMGFRTLAIQKRSGEVWQVLADVKSEFRKFEDILQKAQKKLLEAGTDLETLVGRRTRVINRKLRQVEELPVQGNGLPPSVEETDG